MSAVADASALVALLVDEGADGAWAADVCGPDRLAAPQLALFEAANILRRMAVSNEITDDQASLAHRDLLDLEIEHWSYEVLAPRSWELRHNLTVYDASYVALAELLAVPLATLDRRIAKAPGVRCPVLTPTDERS